MKFHTAFVDFDYTLYDTEQAKLGVYHVLERYGVSRDDAESTFNLALHGTGPEPFFDYTFEGHIELVAKLGYRFPRKRMLADMSRILAESYQESDAEFFLSALRGRVDRLVLLTAGSESFQRAKIDSTSIARFFDDIHILHEKKDAYVAGVGDFGARHLFVNDNLRENAAVGKLCPNIVVVTKYHYAKHTDDELRRTNFPFFRKLSDIIPYIDAL